MIPARPKSAEKEPTMAPHQPRAACLRLRASARRSTSSSSRPATVHINDISLLDDTGTDYLTVQVDSAEKDGSFQVVCSDTYGNKFHQSFQAKTDLFSGLTPGTQYTVTIDPLNEKKVTGNYTLMATTIAQTRS